MKNKGLIIALLVAVSFIWGSVVFRVIGNFFSSTEQDDELQIENTQLILPKSSNRDFNLIANYRDPFMGDFAPTEPVYDGDNENNYYNSTPNNHINNQAPWPAMKYFGCIRENKKNNGLVVIKIYNATLNLRKGDEFYYDFKVKNTYRDSVIISRGKEKKTLYRSK